MRVLSLNVWSGKLLSPLLDFLAACDADVLCLQEMLHSSVAMSTEIFGVEGARLNLFDEVCQCLPRYQSFFCPASQKFPHDPAIGDIPVLYGIATFVRGGIPVIRQRVDFVHKDFEIIPRGEPPLPRVAHAFTVWDARHSESVAIAHMHGLWIPAGKKDTSERILQARRFAKLLEDMQPEGKCIACGDWNVLPGSETFDVLGRLGMRDLVTHCGFTDTRTSYYDKPGRYADYMCMSLNMKAEGFRVLAEPEVSDHRALLLEF